jgi:hypothetical protein
MATMLRDASECVTVGERRLYYLFRDKLSDDYLVINSFSFHAGGTEIDFVILHPSEGVYLIEVKDWVVEQLGNVTDKSVSLIKNGVTKEHANPLEQIRNTQKHILNALYKKAELIYREGKHQGNLKFPLNYALAFPNISSEEIVAEGFDNYLPPNKIIDSYIIQSRALSDREFERSLEATRERKLTFPVVLDNDQWIILREFFGAPVVKNIVTDETEGVFDYDQEKLVKLKINKQILIEGPAGSGKSLVLVKRAIYIHEQHPEWKIGVFCFNVVMSNFLRTLFRHEGYGDSFIVSHFTGIKSLGIEIESVDAILIDEGQDIKEEDLKMIFKLLNPETASFTIFHDPNQSIYYKSDIGELLLKSGFEIENTKSLVRQQRSINIIVALAFYDAMNREGESVSDIVEDVLGVSERYFHGYDDLVSSVATGMTRHFSDQASGQDKINLSTLSENHFHSFNIDTPPRMLKHLCPKIKLLVESGEAQYSDFLIIYPNRFIGSYGNILAYSLKKAFEDHFIPFRIIDRKYGLNKSSYSSTTNLEVIEESDNRSSADLSENVVKAMTIHQAKGLDAKYVAILGFDEILPRRGKEAEEVDNTAALGYVALTRATKECLVYYMNENAAIQNLLAILEELKKR